MRRALRVGASLGLALIVLTCTDQPTSVRGRGTAAFDLSPLFLIQPGEPPIPVDSVRVQLHRTSDGTLAFDSAFAVQPPGNSIVIQIAVELRQTTESFFLTVVAFGAGTTWYDLSATVSLTAGQTSAPAPFTANYVGPGANAARVVVLPADTTASGGAPFSLRAVVYDASDVPIAGVPVGYRLSDPTLGAIAYPTPFSATFTGVVTRRDSAWVVAETPTHLKDSTKVHVVPPAATLVMVSGNGQTGPINAALPAPLVVRVLDGLGSGYKGQQVTWTVVTGSGNLSTGTSVSDDTGYATVLLTPTAPGPVSVRASAGSLSGSPQTFNATAAAAAPANIQIISGNGQSDTVRSTLAPLVVKVTDALNNPFSGAQVAWSRIAGAGTVSADTTITNAAGLTQITYTLGGALGTEQVRATLVATLGNVSFTATATPGNGTPTSTTVTPNLDTLTALTATVALTAQAKNNVGNPVAGSFTWVSRAPGVATVNGSGLVTAVANGSTYVVATETGGTKDSALIVVQQRPANIQIMSGNTQSDTVRSTLAPFVVKVTDGLNNPFTGAQVAWSRIAGAGTVSADTTITDALGQTQITYTLGGALGTEQVRATLVANLANVSFTATATPGTGTPTSTTVTPHLDSLTALTATVALSAQAKNNVGNPVAGSFTWVSRAPGVATVNGSGLVTAVANGSAYVVATEAGGTKDSALIVVQQRIATVNVTPGTRTIYLTRTFTFTAAAVDGLGQPVAGPVFTWSSTAPAVASVDAGGTVTAAGLGPAQIRATAGGITGVANVSVITPITRIAVVVDTVGAATTDTFTLTSLGLTRRYRAVAHDTLDAVMSGVSFTWVSTNGAVAVLGSNAGDTTTATSAANGVTRIQATAQGFTSTPGAQLTVSQVLASIVLDPPPSNPSATIDVTGTIGLIARGKDANSRFIAGGSFNFASANPSVATVNAATGVVTGVSTGTSDITATSGAITSNLRTVTVAAGGPAIISFGRDTVSVGRGSSASIPILLSKPVGSPLTVNLTSTGFAHWNPASIVIPANVTSANATLVGDSAGTATVTAADGSGLGYTTGNAIAKVTANMRLTLGAYALNVTDFATTQVVLSDPSPAGGTYVTFNYSTPGRASISPDPAFIPAGQLAADIQIHAVGAGTTTITPSAIGVNGTASNFTAYAPVLTPSATVVRVGAGQYQPNVYVSLPTNTNVPVPVTLTSSDTNVVTVTPSVTIPGGISYAYFTISTRALGAATITLSSPGWTASGNITVTATTPHAGICCGATLFTTAPLQNVTVYAEDSLGNAHPRTNSLVVRVSSTDSTIMRVLDSVVTIGPGQSFNSAARVIPGGLVGTAYVVATAGGHTSDSALFTVQGPPLSFSWGATTRRLGAGQYDNNVYVSVPNNVTAPLVVTLANTDSSVLGAPTSVTIPTSLSYAYFTVRGKTQGSVTLTASAPGYQPKSGAYAVTTPRITACCNTTYNNFGPPAAITVYSADSAGTTHVRTSPLTVTLASTDPAVLTVDSTTVTIDSGQSFNSRAKVTPVGVGTAKIIYSAAGHLVFDSLTINVVTPKVSFSFATQRLGRRQHFAVNDQGFYVSVPNNRVTPLTTTITQLHGTVDSLTTTTPTIPAGFSYIYLDTYALTTGTDTLIVSAPGYFPDTAILTVTTPQFTTCCMPSATTTTNPPINLTVYTSDSVGNTHISMDTIVVAALSSDTTVIRPSQRFFRILKNANSATTQANIIGPGTADITYSDSAATGYRPVTTGTITVTGPSLSLTNGTPRLGMRQTGSSGSGSSYVSIPNSLGTPLVVNLASTNTRVATVPPSVTIPPGITYTYFDVTALDTIGTIQIQATATGYSGASMNVQVTPPKFVVSTTTQLNTTSSARGITITAADSTGTTHYTTEAVTVTLLSSLPSVASIDSATVTIPARASSVSTAKWTPGVVGTSQLSASDGRAGAYYQYITGTQDVTVVTPSLSFSWSTLSLGIGQYVDQYVSTPDNAVSPINVAFAHVGAARTETDTGGISTTGVTIPTGFSYKYFRTIGTVAGTDSLVGTTSSPVHNPDTAYTTVGQGRLDPVGNWPASLKVGDSVPVTLYARDPSGNQRFVLAATTFTLGSIANIEFHSGGVTITQVTIPANQSSVVFYVKGITAGTGSATISAPNYQSYPLPTLTITP